MRCDPNGCVEPCSIYGGSGKLGSEILLEYAITAHGGNTSNWVDGNGNGYGGRARRIISWKCAQAAQLWDVAVARAAAASEAADAARHAWAGSAMEQLDGSALQHLAQGWPGGVSILQVLAHLEWFEHVARRAIEEGVVELDR
eukprot:CAMPEP_0119307472 /NCGR_PEP_ID=MMETSP1333-20130426/7959_1 /TAXON_ID=418940 /ORGANISM="Scyphosphaera apsteinii, Strain RCC1455" /LENGTH=142 /DNA_ID=CAMNT_0007311025 /DNA_START=139 /DNA_END=567 /DNA_ORIENTATION=+